MMEPVGFGIAAAVWRYVDGSDKRPKGSNLIAFAIVLAAGLWAVRLHEVGWPISVDYLLSASPILIPTLIAGWLMVRGMPGWTEWKPMLLGFAVPTAAASLLYSIATVQLLGQYPSIIGAIAYGASGLALAGCYVLLSRIESCLGSLPGLLTAEKWGRLSYGFIIFSLALL